MLQGDDPSVLATWADAYVELAARAAQRDLISGLAGEVQIRRAGLEAQLSAARLVAERERSGRMTRLHDALAVAEDIGLENPAEGATLIAINTRNAEGSDSGGLLYLRGAKALRSELQQLKQRQNDDAYISEMPNLIKKLALLDGIQLSPEGVSAATIDRAAIVPLEPVKPKKALIISFGMILGLVLGIFAALLRHMMPFRYLQRA